MCLSCCSWEAGEIKFSSVSGGHETVIWQAHSNGLSGRLDVEEVGIVDGQEVSCCASVSNAHFCCGGCRERE